ncbi:MULTISPECIES: M14 family metallocarboxypeptidase [unclassified Pseudoalteromonas]|uniref:M14 family metallopeptidase n=1 Tax=unclassified Pseudoalteromonas TaxID=194690 RepID=UPI000C079570|nr:MULTISPECIES: M14 family metallocarboxypeptidase [unclassified Pseudoalteromonas]MDP2633694.1 M14 family metallocarboxypeptidase [Pseudoalteromonas sp. 1_MG-2023]PHN89676.1 peptidase [Pseudoalteromonas sp. 3D05]
MSENNYHIGTPGVPWTSEEEQQWFNEQTIKRSYQQDVVALIDELTPHFDVEQYGALDYDIERYPLFLLKSKDWHADKPTVLVTGGVHGYETSGVLGAVRFAKTHATSYSEQFNLIIAPCISPWGYETINRWNPKAVDPNRSFYNESPAPESAAIMAYMHNNTIQPIAHIDLHETTDTDNSEFRPALAARQGSVNKNWNIPDGFYLVADSVKPEHAFQTAIINTVSKVTHIAPSDENNQLIGVAQEQFGVINYSARELGLCMGFTDAKYVTTTEVYPDSSTATDEECILAQVAAITGALDYIIAN